MRLQGKVAIVTGAARGIGFACAKRFAREGAYVMIADNDSAAGEQAVAKLAVISTRVAFQSCDVADRRQVETLIGATVRAFGQLDILMSNAGITGAGQLVDVDEAAFDRVVRINLKGVFLCGQAAARQMIKQGHGGAIVNTSSVAAELAMPTEMAYSATKGAVRQLTKAMALSLAPHGIRVNAIGPGSVETELVRSMWRADPRLRQQMLSRTPLGRLGQPKEIASVALFLASRDASYVTGQTIYVDGGRLSLNFSVAVPDAE
jgi:glucose 1-dehydrogenase